MKEQRWQFARDDDCNWYLIKVEDYPLFIQLLENGEADYWEAFNDRFEEYRIDSYHGYTFVDPKQEGLI